MNPRAPHYKFRSSASSTSSGKDLESIYGSLRNSFVPAPNSMNGAPEAPSPTTTTNNTREPPAHSRSLVKFQPHKSSDDELLERARSEQLEQNQLAMHTRLLRLADQVTDLTAQRAAFEEEKAQSDKIIKELRREVDELKTQTQKHHDKLEVCKRGVDDNAREIQDMDQRIKAVPGSLNSRFQHHTTRLDKVESLVRGAGVQIKQHDVQLRDSEERIGQLEHKAGGITTTNSYNNTRSEENGKIPGVNQVKQDIEKIQQIQNSHKSYLGKTGQTLIDHETNMDTISMAINDLRSELETLSTSNARLSSNRNSGNAESPKSNASSDANDVENLMIQMDVVRKNISILTDMHRHMDQISLASKISLEAMFYQLTKELEGRCYPENIEFGLDEDRLFILRQRVLERLSVEDSVQCEFLRLKASQQMFS